MGNAELAAKVAVIGSFIISGIGTAAALAFVPPLLYVPVGVGALTAFHVAYHAVKQLRQPDEPERDDADVPPR